MSFVVAYHHPHNDGLEAGIITGPGFDTELRLADTNEVDAGIASFATEAEARSWLDAQQPKEEPLDLVPTNGGYAHSRRFGDEDSDED